MTDWANLRLFCYCVLIPPIFPSMNYLVLLQYHFETIFQLLESVQGLCLEMPQKFLHLQSERSMSIRYCKPEFWTCLPFLDAEPSSALSFHEAPECNWSSSRSHQLCPLLPHQVVNWEQCVSKCQALLSLSPLASWFPLSRLTSSFSFCGHTSEGVCQCYLHLFWNLNLFHQLLGISPFCGGWKVSTVAVWRRWHIILPQPESQQFRVLEKSITLLNNIHFTTDVGITN